MYKSKVKWSFILTLGICIFSCTKEAKEHKEEEKPVVKTEITENKTEIKRDMNAPVKSPEQTEAEEKYKKGKEYEEKLDQIERELYRKENAIIAQFPVDATDADLEQKKARTWEYDDEKKVYTYVIFEEVIKEGDVYHCKQKVKTQNGGMLDYNLKIKKPRFRKYYTVSGIELMSYINIGNINEKIMAQQVHEEIYDLKNDEKKAEMIKLFEEYENTQYPLYYEIIRTDWRTGGKLEAHEQYDMRVLDYVKG
ncbi:MAG: clustered-type lipoprotein, partial [Treponema pedis]